MKIEGTAVSKETQNSACSRCLYTRAAMHEVRSLACVAAVLLLVELLMSAVAGAAINESVAVLSYQEEELTEQPFTSVEQATDANVVSQTDTATSNETLSGDTNSWTDDPENLLKPKVGVVSNDLLKFIQVLSKTNSIIKKQQNVRPKKHSEVTDLYSLKFRLQKLLVKCVEKFGAKCVKIMSKFETGRHKRDSENPFKEYEVESINLSKNFAKKFPINLQTEPSDVKIANDGIAENESVTQYVFRELQNLLHESRSDLLGESMELKLVDVGNTNLNKPVDSEFYSSFDALLNPISNNRHEYRKTTPFLKTTTTQPAPQNSFSTPDIFFSKFDTSNPKNRLSEFHTLSSFPKTTESGMHFSSATEPHTYQNTHSTGRYPRSTTSQGSVFQSKDPYYFRAPAAVDSAYEVPQGYSDHLVDYVTAKYGTTNPKQTLKELLSQGSIRTPLSEDVEYEIVNSYPESYDESTYPMYEYFVISEHSENEPSYLSLPFDQEETYMAEKQVYEETQVPVQLVSGNRVSPASSTRFISTTPLSNDELYQIIKERIPLSSDKSQSFSIVEPFVKTRQQGSSKISTESQLTSPSNFESPRSSTPSYSFKSSIPKDTMKPFVVNIQEFDDTIQPNLQSAHTLTNSYDSSMPIRTTKPLVVNIQESDHTIRPDLQSAHAFTNSYDSSIPLRTTKPSVVNTQGSDDTIRPDLKSAHAFTNSYDSSIPIRTTKPLVVNTQESDKTILSDFQSAHAFVNSYDSSIPMRITKPSVVNMQESDDTIQPDLQSAHAFTNSYDSSIPIRTTKPFVVNMQESADTTVSDFQSDSGFTNSFMSMVPEDTTKPLVVDIQESDDETILPDMQSEPALSSETTTLDSTVVTNSYTANNLKTTNVPVVTDPITESTTTEQDIGLTTTLQELITAIENQLGTTAITLEEPMRTDIPMQVTVTSDEITVSGPDTRSISTILYELRQPLLSTPSPFASFIRPQVNSLSPIEVDPNQFAEFTSSVKKSSKKPSVTTLFKRDSPFISAIPTRYHQVVAEDVYRTSAPVSVEEPTDVSHEIQKQNSNSYGIPEYLIKSELLGDKLKPEVTATHIFGIPKEIVEAELNNDPDTSEEPELLIMTSTTNTVDKEPINLIDQPLVHKLEGNYGDDLPFNGIPLSMLNAELRSRPEEGDGYNLNFELGLRDKIEQLSTPSSTFYIVDDESRSSTTPFITTEKADGSFLTNFMSIFSPI
ncbi:hypothetical protein FHG87_009990 [Trinorchestia longiramus]|nr:hypothetical protein FHG87_009990 [Trinorchestia longiramus]